MRSVMPQAPGRQLALLRGARAKRRNGTQLELAEQHAGRSEIPSHADTCLVEREAQCLQCSDTAGLPEGSRVQTETETRWDVSEEPALFGLASIPQDDPGRCSFTEVGGAGPGSGAQGLGHWSHKAGLVSFNLAGALLQGQIFRLVRPVQR